MTNLTDYRAEQIADEAAIRLAQPDLKPCPFCGGEATLHPFFSGRYMAVCKKCSVNMPMRDTYEEAIEAWNTRAHKPFVLMNGVAFCCECGTCIGRHDDHYSECPSCGAKVIETSER